MEIEQVTLANLIPYPGNARIHDLETIKESLREHGQIKPLIVQARTGIVLAGNGTREAMLEMGTLTGDAYLMDVDDDQAARINLIDNRAYDLGSYDPDLLQAQLGKLSNLHGTGWNDRSRDDLIAQLEQAQQLGGGAVDRSYAEANRGPGEDPHPFQASSVIQEALLMFSPADMQEYRQAALAIQMELKLPNLSAAVLYAVKETMHHLVGSKTTV